MAGLRVDEKFFAVSSAIGVKNPRLDTSFRYALRALRTLPHEDDTAVQ